MELAVGDPARSAAARGVYAVLTVAVGEFAYLWLGKGLPILYAGQPWREDPYDALVSFMFVVLPLLIGVAAVRLWLCRRREAFPVRRLVDLLRACKILVWSMSVVVAAEWIAVVAVGPANSTRTVYVAWIAALTAVSSSVIWSGRRIGTASAALRSSPASPQPDWLADFLVVLDAVARRVPRVGSRLAGQVTSVGGRLADWVRKHPLATAALVALLISLSTDTPQALIEGYRPALAVWFFMVSTSSLFAFLVILGRYLPLIEISHRRLSALEVAVVTAATAVPMLAAFRDMLYRLVGSSTSDAGFGALVLLTTVWPVLIGVLSAILFALARALRPDPPTPAQ